jgi:hypothetical protein
MSELGQHAPLEPFWLSVWISPKADIWVNVIEPQILAKLDDSGCRHEISKWVLAHFSSKTPECAISL